MHYVGLDVHAKRSSLCILDSRGTVVKRLEVKGSWPKVLEQVAAQVPRPFSVCFEASCGYGYLHERLSALAEHVAVAHPGKLRLVLRRQLEAVKELVGDAMEQVADTLQYAV